MNVPDIKLALDDMGVTYPVDAKKAKLEALLQEAQEAAAALAASTPTEDADSPAEPADATAEPAFYTARVLPEGGLNVRSAPGGAFMFVAPCGIEATVFAEDDDGWARIGIEGWVRREFLS